MSQKLTITVSIIALLLLLASSLQFGENRRLSAEFEKQEDFKSQLLTQVEDNTIQRLDFEKRIAGLEKNLISAANQIQTLSGALQEARENVSPDIEKIRQQARLEIKAELENDNPNSIAAITARMRRPEVIESFARIQMNLQYGEFIGSLKTDQSRADQIKNLLVDILAEQNLGAVRLAAGELELSEITETRAPDYIRNQLASLLTPDELREFEDYESGNSERMLRRTYTSQIYLTAPGLSEPNRQILVDSMVSYLSPQGENYQVPDATDADSTIEWMWTRQLDAITLIRQQLQTEFEPEQMREANNFLNQMQSTLEATRNLRDTRRAQ